MCLQFLSPYLSQLKFQNLKNPFAKFIFYLKKTTKILACIALVFLLLVFSLAFTTLPFHVMHYMGTSNTELTKDPDVIILLGGAGMPNEENLMRLYYTSHIAAKFENAKIILALPGELDDSTSAINEMKSQLVLNGVDQKRIVIENQGLNTRHQALASKNLVDTLQTVLLITSPFHMYRSILVFKKAGFQSIGGIATFNGFISHNILFDNDVLGGNKIIPGIGENLQIRYQFWNHLKYEVDIAREFFALFYYKIKGWI